MGVRDSFHTVVFSLRSAFCRAGGILEKVPASSNDRNQLIGRSATWNKSCGFDGGVSAAWRTSGTTVPLGYVKFGKTASVFGSSAAGSQTKTLGWYSRSMSVGRWKYPVVYTLQASR